MTGRTADDEALRAGAAELGVPLDDETADRLLDFLALLYRWNRRIDLTSIDARDAVRLHLLDSLALLPRLGPAADLADLGSGAGLPGIPLALAAPHLRVTLVESKRKRCSFLLEAVRDLGIRNCTVMEEDARVLAASGRQYDAVTGRAFLAPADLVELAAPMVSAGGRILICGGSEPPIPEDLAQGAGAGFRVRFADELRLPGGSERRHIIALERDR